jgi:hypothetical protein
MSKKSLKVESPIGTNVGPNTPGACGPTKFHANSVFLNQWLRLRRARVKGNFSRNVLNGEDTFVGQDLFGPDQQWSVTSS